MEEVKKLKSRNEISEQDKWDIKKLYESDEKWEEDFATLKKNAPKLKEYDGKINSGKAILEYIECTSEISRLAEKLVIYGHLRADEDTGNTKYQSMRDKIFTYIAELQSYDAFFVPELLSLSNEDIERFFKEEEKLKEYKFFIEKILKEKDHILSKEQEELLAIVSDCLDAPEKIFNMLTNADISFGNIKDENGQEVELTEGNYVKFLRSTNRSVRENAFKEMFGTYSNYKNTLSQTLMSSVKNTVFYSKIRKYNSSLEASLKPKDIPLEVFHSAIKVIDENLKSLHKYVEIKKKLLKIDKMHMYDLYVPLIEVESEHIEFDEGVKIALNALKPLGEEYLNIFKEGIESSWIDKYENRNKRSGAYSSGCYDSMPYILLNYNYDLNDVSTLVHEMGHSIHSYLSRKNQSYLYSNYTIFCAEVASTTNEILLIDYLIKNEKDKNRKLYLINQELEQIRATVFRQILFSEFELMIHEEGEKGNSLTWEDFNNMWHSLNKKYYGDNMEVDEEIAIEWARIPHFYSDFYVYQYATGYAAASSFARKILSGESDAVSKYFDFLKSGGSDYSINILKNSGVDMTSTKPMEDLINRFNELLDMLTKEALNE